MIVVWIVVWPLWITKDNLNNWNGVELVEVFSMSLGLRTREMCSVQLPGFKSKVGGQTRVFMPNEPEVT